MKPKIRSFYGWIGRRILTIDIPTPWKGGMEICKSEGMRIRSSWITVSFLTGLVVLFSSLPANAGIVDGADFFEVAPLSNAVAVPQRGMGDLDFVKPSHETRAWGKEKTWNVALFKKNKAAKAAKKKAAAEAKAKKKAAKAAKKKAAAAAKAKAEKTAATLAATKKVTADKVKQVAASVVKFSKNDVAEVSKKVGKNGQVTLQTEIISGGAKSNLPGNGDGVVNVGAEVKSFNTKITASNDNGAVSGSVSGPSGKLKLKLVNTFDKEEKRRQIGLDVGAGASAFDGGVSTISTYKIGKIEITKERSVGGGVGVGAGAQANIDMTPKAIEVGVGASGKIVGGLSVEKKIKFEKTEKNAPIGESIKNVFRFVPGN